MIELLFDRLEVAGDKRRARDARKWFGDSGRRDAARVRRAETGTLKEQRQDYRQYIAGIAAQIEERGRGGGGVTRRVRGAQARGDKNTGVADILVMSPDAMRKRLSPEAFELLAEIGRPLPFDAWRHAYRGATDARAVASHQKRSGGFFSEYG